MKIKASVKLYVEYDTFFSHLSMKVKFKLPNEMLKREIEVTLLSDAFNRVYSKGEKDFVDEVLDILSNKELLIQMAEKGVRDYMKEHNIQMAREEKVKQIDSLIKGFNGEKIEIEIEI